MLLMPRGAQVIYPKDLGAILIMADIAPGAARLRERSGLGALSTAMLRVGAKSSAYEVREDFASRARANVVAFLGEGDAGRYRVELRDAYDGIDDGPYDRVVLDLPEPWQVVPHAEKACSTPAGCCAPTRRASCRRPRRARRSGVGPWVETRTLEVLQRTWHVEGWRCGPTTAWSPTPAF